MNNPQQLQLQEIVIDFFKDVEDETFIKVVDAFVYGRGTADKNAIEILNDFIKENELEQALIDYQYNLKNPIFLRNVTGTNMINDLKLAFLNASYNRFRKLDLGERKLERTEVNLLKAELKYAKFHALTCFESLNRSGQYFYSEEEDAKIVVELEKIKV